jgi:hypothetical protein
MILSILAQIVVTNKLSLRGNELVNLETSKQQLQKDISRLEFDESKLSSLSYLDSEAKKLGFVTMTDTVYTVNQVSNSSVAVLTSY